MNEIEVRPATGADLRKAAGLRWQWMLEDADTPAGTEAEFVEYFTTWARSAARHECFLAVRGDSAIGMAWLAVTDRTSPCTPVGGGFRCICAPGSGRCRS